MTHWEEGMTLEDVLYDLHGPRGREARGVRTVEAAASRCFQESGTRAWDHWRRAVSAGLTRGESLPWGENLIRRCAPAGQRRIALLLDQEAHSPPDGNYLLPVFLGVTLLEGELSRLLAEPVRPLAPVLVEAQKQHSKKYKTDGLEAWGEGKVPPTLGLVGQVMLGLRWGLGQGRPEIEAFLREHFAAPYRAVVADKALGTAVNQVRETFRNPTCHGEQDFFGAAEYQEFAQLLTGWERFRDWQKAPSDGREPPASQGVLHHHLTHSQLAAQQASDLSEAEPAGVPVSDALQRQLLDLRSPAGDGWRLEVWPCLAESVPTRGQPVRAVTRDMGEAPPPTEGYRIGQNMSLALRSDRPGHLAVVDVGTSGRAWALCPSNMCRDSFLPAGLTFLPPPYERWPAFHLTGQPGVERIVAVATAQPLPLDWQPDAPDRPCRELTGADLTQLLNDLVSLPEKEWSVARCEFELMT